MQRRLPNLLARFQGGGRRFPPCFVVRDHSGQALGYFHYETGSALDAKLFTRDEARRIAVNVAKHGRRSYTNVFDFHLDA
jgi:hypothetical protein